MEPVLLPRMAPVFSGLIAVSIGSSTSLPTPEQIRSTGLDARLSLSHDGVMVTCLYRLLRESCIDIALQCHDIGLIDVDELYAHMENILGKAFRMYDPGPGIEGQPGLCRWLQVELDLDHDARDLSGGTLILRQDLMDCVTPAAEFKTAGRQIDDHNGEILPLRQAYCTRNLCVNPEILSFFLVHVSLAGILLSGTISLRIHFLILPCRNMGVNLGICASNVKQIARARSAGDELLTGCL